MINLEAIYHQGLASGNHVTGLEAVYQAGADSVVKTPIIPDILLSIEEPLESIAVESQVTPEMQAEQAIT